MMKDLPNRRGGGSSLAGLTRRTSSAAMSTTLLICVALLLGGCAGSEDSASDAGVQPHEGKRLAIVQAGTDGYNVQVTCGAVEEGERLGLKVEKPQAPKKYGPAEQNALVNAVLARSPAALVYLPQDAKASGVPVKSAAQAGLKVAAIDTMLDDESLVTSFIASDHFEGGKAGAEEVIREIGGHGKVLAVGLIPDHPITKGRIGGFESVIESAPGVTYLGAKYPDLDVAKVTGAVAAVIAANPDLKAIYTMENTIAGAGVVTALKEAGLTDRVKHVTWDYDAKSQKYLEAGEVSAIVAQNPREMGRIAVEQLVNALDGKTVNKEVHPPLAIVTAENREDPEIASLLYRTEC
jgi:ribose transport system substrate-binding protein